MKVDEIPQDDSILEGHRRACYALDQNGRYVIATSRGWEVERIANAVAIEAVDRVIAAARDDVRAGRASVLAYHMACRHMDVGLLARTAGLWRFQVRRHLRPALFMRLSDAMIERYARALGVAPDALRRLPD